MLNFPAIKTKLDTTHNITPSQKVILEWNYNVTVGINEMGIDDTKLYEWDNDTSDLKLIESSSVYNKYYESIYPLTSIVSLIRPSEYAVHNNAKVGGVVKAIAGSTSGNTTYSQTAASRNYFASKDDGYKYWAHIRKGQSGSTVNKSVYAIYDRDIKVNKVVVKFETFHTIPQDYKVFLRVSGAWVQAFSSTTPITNGGLVLYYNGTAWTTTKHTAPSITQNTQTVTGIKVFVGSVNVGYAPLEIIEMSPRLEVNITEDVVSWDIQKTMYEDHEVLPVGTISSNSADVMFDNTFNNFSYEKTDAKYYGLMDKRVGVKIFSIIDSTEIPQFTGYVDSWSISASESATANCYDMAKVLQQTQAPDMVIGFNYSINKLMRVAFDGIGLNELILDANADDKDNIPVFWMSKEQTFWEALQELCISHQCVLYFDEYGRPVFKSRKSVLDSATVEQKLTYAQDGTLVPNIINVGQSAKPRVGSLSVKYSRRSFETQNDILTSYNLASTGKSTEAIMFRGSTYATVLWAPDKSWVLGAVPLMYAITATDTEINIQKPELYQVLEKNKEPLYKMLYGLPLMSGYFYLNGEIIYYGATQFKITYKDGRSQELKDISTTEEYQSLVNSDPGISTIIHNGKLTKVKRGQFMTTAKVHSPVSIDNGDWSLKQFAIKNSAAIKNLSSPKFDIGNRALKLSTDNDTGASSLDKLKQEERRNYIQIGSVNLKKSNYKRFEANMMFIKQQPTEKVGDIDSIGGIFFDFNESTKSGYFIELGLEETTLSYKKADANKSIMIYKLKPDGTMQVLGSCDAPVGRAKRDGADTIFKDSVSFVEKQNYDIQVMRIKSGGTNWIDLYLMGQLVLQVEDKTPLAQTTIGGCFVRGDSTAFFSKFAAWGANDESTLQDGSFFADSIRGFMTEVIAAGSLGVPSKSSLENDYDYYEFYPHIREIRIEEFDYTQPPGSPIKIAAGASVSQYGATILESNSFRAKIAAVNETNEPLDISSSFPGTAAAGYPKLLGYTLKKFEPKEYKTTVSKSSGDDSKFEIDSEWIQSESQAKDIAEFIKVNSAIVKAGKTNDPVILDVEIFTNPLVQLGDTVDISYPDLGLSYSSHSFIITSISQSFSNGISTSIRLQEVV
jgi:hypothetical protein